MTALRPYASGNAQWRELEAKSVETGRLCCSVSLSLSLSLGAGSWQLSHILHTTSIICIDTCMHCIHPSVHPSIQWHTTAACIKIAGIAINLLGDRCAILLTTSPPPDVLHQRDTASLGAVPLHIQLLRWLCPGVTWGTWRRSQWGQWGCLMLGGWVYKPYRTGKSSLEDRFYWNFEPWSSGLNAPAWYGLRSFSRWIGWSSMLMAC